MEELIAEIKAARKESPDLAFLSRRAVEDIVDESEEIKKNIMTMAEEAQKSRPDLFPIEVLRQCFREQIISSFLKAQQQFE